MHAHIHNLHILFYLSILTLVTFRGEKKSLQVNALVANILQQISKTVANLGPDAHFDRKRIW